MKFKQKVKLGLVGLLSVCNLAACTPIEYQNRQIQEETEVVPKEIQLGIGDNYSKEVGHGLTYILRYKGMPSSNTFCVGINSIYTCQYGRESDRYYPLDTKKIVLPVRKDKTQIEVISVSPTNLTLR